MLFCKDTVTDYLKLKLFLDVWSLYIQALDALKAFKEIIQNASKQIELQ